MTLIITALAGDAMVQVSDRRLTVGGRLYDDKANKAVCVECRVGRFAVGYTGLAEIEDKKTDIWLVDQFTDIVCTGAGLPAIVDGLAQRATGTYAGVALSGREKGLTIVLAGFWAGTPFFCTVTNMEKQDGTVLSEAEAVFSAFAAVPKQGLPAREVQLISAHGAEGAISGSLEAALRKIRSRARGLAGESVAGLLVDIVRRAADHPQYGHLIGKDCMSAVVRPDGDFVAEYHPLDAGRVAYAPHYVSPSASFRDLEVWAGPDKPPWWHEP